MTVKPYKQSVQQHESSLAGQKIKLWPSVADDSIGKRRKKYCPYLMGSQLFERSERTADLFCRYLEGRKITEDKKELKITKLI